MDREREKRGSQRQERMFNARGPNPTFSGFHQRVIYVVRSFIPAGTACTTADPPHTHTHRQKQTRKTPAVRNPPNVNHGQFQNKLFLIIINKKRGSKKGNEI